MAVASRLCAGWLTRSVVLSERYTADSWLEERLRELGVKM